jgi:hypothetical protein
MSITEMSNNRYQKKRGIPASNAATRSIPRKDDATDHKEQLLDSKLIPRRKTSDRRLDKINDIVNRITRDQV